MPDAQPLGTYIPRLLVERGIDTVFGIPGVHTVELYRGMPGSQLRHVTPRHEQGAGFMADGYARASGRPAACFIRFARVSVSPHLFSVSSMRCATE